MILPVTLGLRPARADDYGPEAHGLSIFGDLSLPPDYPHLPYVDPKAPVGGEIRLQIDSSQGTTRISSRSTR